MSASGNENHAFFSGLGTGEGFSSRLPDQLLYERQKNDNWKEFCLDRLEEITTRQIAENQPLNDFYEMRNGNLVYSDYGLEDFSKEVIRLRGEMDYPAHAKHYDFLGIICNQIESDWITSKSKMHIDNTDEFSQNDFLRTLDSKKYEYIVKNFDLELKRKLLAKGINLEEERQFNSEEEQQQYAQQLQAQKDKLIDPEQAQKTLQKSWKTVATEWAEKVMEIDTDRFGMEVMSREEMTDRILTGRWFRHYHIGFDFYKPQRWHPCQVAFSKDIDIKYPQDAEYVCHQTEMSPSSILNTFGHKLTEDIQKRLMGSYDSQSNSSGSYGTGKNYSLESMISNNFGEVQHIPFEGYYDYQNTLQEQAVFNEPMGEATYVDPADGQVKTRPAWFSPMRRGDGFGVNSNIRNLRTDIAPRTDVLLVTECYWRSFKQVGILNYINQDGYLDQEFTTDDLVPQFLKENDIKTLRKVSLEEAIAKREPNTISYTWIPEIRWGVKIKAQNSYLLKDIYIGGDALPYQIKGTLDGGSNLYDAKIPVAGFIGESIAQKIRPEIIQHNIVLNQVYSLLEKELGTFFLFDVRYLPSEYKGSGNTRQALEQMWDMIQDIGIVPIDTSRQNLEGGQPAMNAFSTQAIDYTAQITNRMNLAVQFKIQALEKIGITPQRLGSPSEYSTAEGIKQGQTASYAQTEGIFAVQMEAEKRATLLHLTIAQYCQKEYLDYTSVYTNSDNEKAFIELNDPFFSLREFGLRLDATSSGKKEVETLRQALLQNNTMGSDILDLAEIITSNSMTSLKEHARQNRREQEQKVAQQQQHEKEMQDAMLAAQKENREDIQANLREIQRMKDETTIEAKTIDAYGRMSQNQDASSTLYDRLDKVAELAITDNYKSIEFDQKNKALELQEQALTSKQENDDKEFALKIKQLNEKIEARKSAEKISLWNKN